MKKEKKIPTIIGLFLILATLYVGNSIINRPTSTTTKASGSCEPINLQVTNTTNKSATISFTTLSDCLSVISFENRTIENPKGKSKIHYFDIDSLEESKAYTFSVISGGKNYSSDNFNFKTGQKPAAELPTSNLAWGKVYQSDHSLATQAIIYFSVAGASPLSALVTSSGEWNITLATSFNESLTNYFSMPVNTEENLVVVDDTQTQTQVIGNTNHNNPVPDIIIGQNNFSAPSPAVELPQTSLLNQDYKFSDNSSLTITNPNNNETLSTKRPNFFGTAKPGDKLKIEVHSPTAIDDSTTTDDEGDWDWAPPKDLAPGEHTITVTDENKNTVSKKFVVLAAESNTSFTASSSATPTRTPTSVITPTPTFSPTPTSIPTSTPSTSSGIPRTGNIFPTEIIIALSFFFISFAFVFFKRNND